MSIDRKYRELAQKLLRSNLKIDGQIGRNTRRAFFDKYGLVMSGSRLCAYVIQRETISRKDIEDIEDDGYWGPNTEDAADLIIHGKGYLDRADESAASDNSNLRCWSPKTNRLVNEYGSPGSNQGMCVLPDGISLRLDWDLSTRVSRFTCHESLVNVFSKGFEMVAESYGIGKMKKLGLDRFGGVFNKRRKRGGSTWSVHSFGAAMDIFPSMNRLKWGRDKAVLSGDRYKKWFAIWGRLGFISLGICYNFDWMHIQKNPRTR